MFLQPNDPKAKELYEKACAFGCPDEAYAKYIYEYNLHNRAFELELGCGIKNPQIIWDEFAELEPVHIKRICRFSSINFAEKMLMSFYVNRL